MSHPPFHNRVNGSLANLANSTSTVTNEFEFAEYKCETAGYVLPDGSDTFSVQCEKGGVFPTAISWPTCVDNTTITTPAPPNGGGGTGNQFNWI